MKLRSYTQRTGSAVLRGAINQMFSRNVAKVALAALAMTVATAGFAATGSAEYNQRFLTQYNKIKASSSGYFSTEGVPYHSVETLMVEAPDYGHETTSEAYSYWIWLEAQYGRVTGDWAPLNKAWANMEKYIIPGASDQSGNGYNPQKPATYAPEFDLPSSYPSPMDSGATPGKDPLYDELTNTYGNKEIYGMHWLLDVDNWYGYGRCGDGTTKPSYINTFQRGTQESVWETVTHPSCETFKWGKPNQGFLSLFMQDSNYSQQFRYTNAPDADARAIAAVYWASVWAKEQGKSADVADVVKKAAKMGDYLRYSMFDKYFKKIGNCVGATTCAAGTGQADANGYRDNQAYLMSWYYAWGGALNNGGWSWRIGSSHNHSGYQNPLAAWALSSVADLKPATATGAGDWGKSLKRMVEFYTWLQTPEGAIAGGATNSWGGHYGQPPAGTPSFYGMPYVEAPVYSDPPSNQWFGMQAWSIERLAEYYYVSGDAAAGKVVTNWVNWVLKNVKLNADGTYSVPGDLKWSGAPDTWNASAPGSNANLHVSILNYNSDVGVASTVARVMTYYAAKTKNAEAKTLAKELLDRMWAKYQDSLGVAVPEKRADYLRFTDKYNATTGQGIYIPSGWVGTNAQGATIDSNVTFLSQRPKYKQDKDWAKLNAYLQGGAEPSWTYHRFWSQTDIAISLADYARLLGDASPSVVVSANTLSVNEGSSNTFTVALSDAPAADTTVTIAKVSGEDSVTAATSTLTFTPSNYNVPQTVTIAAANDTDAVDGTATFSASASNYTAASVVVTEIDKDKVTPVVLTVTGSISPLIVPEGSSACFNTHLGAAPANNVTVSVAKVDGGDADLSVASGAALTFTPANWNVDQATCIAAAEDADTTDGTADFTVSAANATPVTVTAKEKDNDVPAGSCAVTIDTTSDWGAGQVIQVSLANTGTSPLNGWSLSWTESNDFSISNSWSSTVAKNGRTITVTPAGWNSSIGANASVGFGMQISYSGAKPIPSGVAVAGQNCTITVK